MEPITETDIPQDLYPSFIPEACQIISEASTPEYLSDEAAPPFRLYLDRKLNPTADFALQTAIMEYSLGEPGYGDSVAEALGLDLESWLHIYNQFRMSVSCQKEQILATCALNSTEAQDGFSKLPHELLKEINDRVPEEARSATALVSHAFHDNFARTIIVTTQQELEKALDEEGVRFIVINGENLEVKRGSANPKTKITVDGNTLKAEAGKITVKGGKVIASGTARVYAEGKAEVEASGNVVVEAREDSRVRVCDNVKADVYDRAWLAASGSAKVCCFFGEGRMWITETVRDSSRYGNNTSVVPADAIESDWDTLNSTWPIQAIRKNEWRQARMERRGVVERQARKAEEMDVKRGDVTGQANFCRSILTETWELEFLKKILDPDVFPHVKEAERRGIEREVGTFKDKTDKKTREWIKYYAAHQINNKQHSCISGFIAAEPHIRTVMTILISAGVQPEWLLLNLNNHTAGEDHTTGKGHAAGEDHTTGKGHTAGEDDS
ncbi:hypothetical protein AB0N09_35460 [Streptomyces erythrochromogenes]|uniref:hypothetical protein n=1 Tax=Streptomyces erythrochromogenes TaxID=285574 RepID=UPI0034398ED4